MELKVEGRHFKITESIKEHVEEKLSKLERYFADGIHRVHVILTAEKNHQHTVEIVCTAARRGTLVAKGEAEDMYAAVDVAEKRLEAELKKYKAKLHASPRGASKKGSKMVELGTVEIADDEESES